MSFRKLVTFINACLYMIALFSELSCIWGEFGEFIEASGKSPRDARYTHLFQIGVSF